MELRWFERKFDFSIPLELFPVVVERLRGTPARIEEKVWSAPRPVLTRREGDRWSIQENVGHLLDLEELHIGRLDDFLAGKPMLRAADLANQKTHDANHNERSVEEIVRAFREERERLVRKLERWDAAKISLQALHPRLNQPMRVIDMAFFAAEHDDHHLARMTELARLFA
jgi:uncharacterized damage-inducible protein DinB